MTWKKEDTNALRDGNVANGNWNPDNRQVKFNWNNPQNCNPNIGARLEVSRTKESL